MQSLAWLGRFSLVVLLAGVVSSVPSQAADEARSAEEAQSADDGWRRTAYGWEQTQAWTEPTNHGRPRDRFLFADEHESVDRWDFHPAVLVGLQLGAVTLAWTIWSQLRRSPAVRLTFRREARTAV